MGGLCSKRSAVDKSPSETTLDANGLRDSGPVPNHSHDKTQFNPTVLSFGKAVESRLQEQSFSNSVVPNSGNILTGAAEAEPQLSRALSQKSKSTNSKSTGSAKTGTTKASPCSNNLLVLDCIEG